MLFRSQMGLALVVDQDTQLPLAHQLYEGARSDMKSFAEFLKPIRQRLRALTGQPEQLTIIFDAGASSKKNLADTENYVTAVPPSNHRALLEEAAAELAAVPLSTGAEARAWRARRTIAGKEREVVVIFSQQLHEGQLRGLAQSVARSCLEMEEMGFNPRTSVDIAKRKLKKICGRQYLRALLCHQVDADEQGATRYFGLRVLITDRTEWSTAQIVEAYRGQSKVEAAFRDLKDPRMLSTRPQFHWTDQKLHVHAFMCVTAYLLVTLLHRRATRKAAYEGSSRRLLEELAEVRCCRLVDITGRKGRPRVRFQIEEIDPAKQALAQALGAVPVFR